MGESQGGNPIAKALVNIRERSLIGLHFAKKVPNVLSRCHTKRRTGARGRARPSFGMTPTFQQKKKKKSKIFKKEFFFKKS